MGLKQDLKRSEYDMDLNGEAPIPRSSSWEHQRSQNVFVRSNSNTCRAMSRTERVKKEAKASLKPCFDFCCCRRSRPASVSGEGGNGEIEVKMGDDGDVSHVPVQYRLEATQTVHRSGILPKLASFCCGRTSETTIITGSGISPNQRLAQCLHWCFRVNFLFLFAVMCTMFFALVIMFAGIIVSAGRMDSECGRIGGEPFGHASSDFADAFALSWTTFSTVGYGSTYPALGHEHSNPSKCVYITAVCSLEAFFGVLYSGFCGAILFGKVLRIQSHAQVLFSDPIVIRFGDGVDSRDDDSSTDEDDPESVQSTANKKKIPCPVLEFRVVNRLHNEIGGELMDASLNVVANVDAVDADPSLLEALESSRRHHERSRQRSYPGSTTTDSQSDTLSDGGNISAASSSDIQSFVSSRRPFGGLIHSRRQTHNAVVEDPSSRLVNKRIFSKMLIEQQEHPFFKRVWLARHVLDDSSPIVKPRVRRQIRRNRGYWPERLNSYACVRDSLQFNQILVSLNGVSNVSASDVYAQKIYDFVDINVGYQFVNILYRDASDGSLQIDIDLLNDVREQNGGGGEPLIVGD